MPTTVEGRRPTRARFSWGTDNVMLFPIHNKLADIKPLLRIGLPLDTNRGWTNDLNSETLLTVYQHLRGHIARTRQMLLWGKIRLMQLSLDDARLIASSVFGAGVVVTWVMR